MNFILIQTRSGTGALHRPRSPTTVVCKYNLPNILSRGSLNAFTDSVNLSIVYPASPLKEGEIERKLIVTDNYLTHQL